MEPQASRALRTIFLECGERMVDAPGLIHGDTPTKFSSVTRHPDPAKAQENRTMVGHTVVRLTDESR